jgi:(2Fe-2S) ferredoxin
MKFKKHIFICANQKPDGKKCCGETNGMELVEAFKALIKENNLLVDVRAQRAGCLDVCAFGPALVVYPEGIFYGKVTLADVPELFTSHILNDKPVERLQLKF